MLIIFCADPLDHETPDPMYIDEVASVTRAGLSFVLMDYEALTEQDNVARAVREIPVQEEQQTAIYRGWYLNAAQYMALYDALLSRNIRLINQPQQFRYAQHLPEYLNIIRDHTPETVFMETDGQNIAYTMVMQMLMRFSGEPLFLRDYVRAERQYWYEACYISSASDETAVRNTISRLVELRGKKLEGGLVFREYVEFEPLVEQASRYRMPLVKEFRFFFLDQQPVATVHYWNVPDYSLNDAPDPAQFSEVVSQVRSRFFTLDVAQRIDGTWMIVDLGDAQIAPLPEMAQLDDFYRAIAAL
jgi:hypothetical protein